MAPGQHIMPISQYPSKGGRISYTTPQPDISHDVTHHPDILHEVSTIPQTISTVVNTISTSISDILVTMNDTNASENNSTTFRNNGDQSTNSTNMIPSVQNTTFNESNPLATSTGTSFELITTTLMDGITDGMNMEHTDEMEDNTNYILFIVLGVILGILIIAASVLGVIYNHYKKRGFQEISGEQKNVDPQSMKQLQQASSHDALLDK